MGVRNIHLYKNTMATGVEYVVILIDDTYESSDRTSHWNERSGGGN